METRLMCSPDQHFIVQGNKLPQETLQHRKLPGQLSLNWQLQAPPRRNPGVASASRREPASPSAGSSKHDLSEK